MSEVIDVAAAVFQRKDGKEFLLARRPEGKAYAGYWEFPGGKVEAGESIRQALDRELQEELGITVEAATPWLKREFTYPHANVRIHFWRVTAWSGEIKPLEHSAIEWLKIGGKAKVDPILPANGPILKALALPAVMAITNMSENGEDMELTRLQTAVSQGLRLFQIRDKGLPPIERAWFAQAAKEMVRHSGALLLINDDEGLARAVRANGVHLTAKTLRRCWSRPEFDWVGASCHTEEEIARAVKLELDYVLVSPVLPTQTHPGVPPLGWERFSQLAAISPLPVFALGGMNMSMLAEAQAHGAHGIALMRNW
ncbi:MAG: Nudix family hydrolase [Betaproteobacteria bacterium]